MSLNPNFSDFGASASASAPSAKFTININAFNGNTTVFNRNPPRPSAKAFSSAIHPVEMPANRHLPTIAPSLRPGMFTPM